MAIRRGLALLSLAGVLALAGCGSSGSSHAPPSTPSSHVAPASDSRADAIDAPQPVVPERTVDDGGAFRVAPLSSAACIADAPADWMMTAPDRSDRADLISPDGSMYAGYGILAINTTLQAYAGAYPPPMNDPDLYSIDPATVAGAYGRIVVSEIGGSGDLITEETVQPLPGYLLSVVGGSTHAGAILFHETGYPGDGLNYSYALPMYFAFTTLDRWERHGARVARVAASIRCSTQFQPPDDYPVVEASEAGVAGDENGDDAGYNPQLGTEPVNDPSTGDNYLVDPSVEWSETGPDGPGYYVAKGGGDYQKLEPGRLD